MYGENNAQSWAPNNVLDNYGEKAYFRGVSILSFDWSLTTQLSQFLSIVTAQVTPTPTPVEPTRASSPTGSEYSLPLHDTLHKLVYKAQLKAPIKPILSPLPPGGAYFFFCPRGGGGGLKREGGLI